MSKLGDLIDGDRINLERISFLLVDENEQSLDIMGQVVSGFGARTMVKCRSLLEAMETVGEMPIDFVLADAHLRDDDGATFVRWLRHEAAEPSRYAPTVMVTADPRTSLVERVRDEGAHFVITKPLTPKTLLQRIMWMARENREFINSEAYAGPDRRFKRLGPPPGTKGRRSADRAVKLTGPAEPNLSQDEINALMKPAKVTI